MSDNTNHTDSTSFRPIGDDSAGYDPTTGTFHRQFDVDADTMAGAIVETVGTAANCDPITMAPLYDTVDPEALESLVTATRDRRIEVTFAYEGFRVIVSNDGSIVVEPSEA